MKKSVSAELPGKISFTSSVSNQFGEIDLDNLNLEKNNSWHPFQGYGNTKLMVSSISESIYLIMKSFIYLFNILIIFLKKKQERYYC
jgi:hypothetical protein